MYIRYVLYKYIQYVRKLCLISGKNLSFFLEGLLLYNTMQEDWIPCILNSAMIWPLVLDLQ